MLDTQGFCSRKQLAQQQGVNTSTIWRWFKSGKVEKDNSTGNSLYRMTVSSASKAAPLKPVQQSVAKPAVTEVAEPVLQTRRPQPSKPKAQRNSALLASQRPQKRPSKTRRRSDKAPRPIHPIVVDSVGRPTEGKWTALSKTLTPENLEDLAAGGAVVALLAGAFYVFKPILSRPAVMPPHIPNRRQRRTRKATYRRALRHQWSKPRPVKYTPEAIRYTARLITDIGDIFSSGLKAKPPLPRR